MLGRELIPTHQLALQLGPFELPSGTSSLRLVASPGPVPLGPSDPRLASVFLIAPVLRPLTVYPSP